MSVVKSQRKESKFEVLHHAYQLRKEITDMLLHDFGYRPKPKEGVTENEYQQQRRYAFESWFIQDSREVIIKRMRDLIANLIAANTMYPVNDAEWTERRLYQDRAIINCYQLLQELQYAIETIHPDINRYTRLALEIDTEIKLIKGWRKSDNKVKSKPTGRAASI